MTAHQNTQTIRSQITQDMRENATIKTQIVKSIAVGRSVGLGGTAIGPIIGRYGYKVTARRLASAPLSENTHNVWVMLLNKQADLTMEGIVIRHPSIYSPDERRHASKRLAAIAKAAKLTLPAHLIVP